MIILIILLVTLATVWFSVNTVYASGIYEKEDTSIDAIISFDAGFPDIIIDDMVCRAHERIILPAASREGYMFDGWCDAYGKNFIQDDILLKSKYDKEPTVICLYAKWIKIIGDASDPYIPSVMVNFNTGISKTYCSVKIAKTATQGEYTLPAPEYPGLVFRGWYTYYNNSCTDDNFMELVANTDEAVGTLDLHAKWDTDIPVNTFTNENKEKITETGEWKNTITSTSVYSNGCKSIITTVDTVKDNYVIVSDVNKKLFYTDGTSETEDSHIYYGYHDYYNSEAKDSLVIEVVDSSGNPVEGICVNFKIQGTSQPAYTDHDGRAFIEFDKGSEFSAELKNLPSKYETPDNPQILGYGCMYSVIYKGTYVLADKGSSGIQDAFKNEDVWTVNFK